jgi:hypothetical protein
VCPSKSPGSGQMYLAWQGNAAEILTVLDSHGLNPEWDGSDHTKILITLTDHPTGPNRVILQLGKPIRSTIGTPVVSRDRPNATTDCPKPKHEPSLKMKRSRKKVFVMAAGLPVRRAGISPVAWTRNKSRPVMLAKRGQVRSRGSIRLTELESDELLPAWMTKAAQTHSVGSGSE